MILILIGANLAFFGFGYLSTDTAFDRSYSYYSRSSDLGLLYFFSILVGILLLIGWLVFYSRNNGFKAFYPRTGLQVYLEWILIFVIMIGITSIPFSLTEGYVTKWKSAASEKDVQKAIVLLDKIELLIPTDNQNFRYDGEYDLPISIPDEINLKADSVDLNLFATEYSQKYGITIKGYTGPSLLFYKDYNYRYYRNYDDSESEKSKTIKRQQAVKDLLLHNEKDSIYALMNDFYTLLNKHNIKYNFTADMWIERIYNPPFFPVNNSTEIERYYPYNNKYYSESDYEYYNTGSIPCLPYEEISSGYEQIQRYYNNQEDIEWISLFCMCVALCISIFIFSFRMTGGKPWLISFVATGIMIFATVLLAVALGESLGWRNEEIIIIFVFLLWIGIFAGLLGRILFKINNKQNKGRSRIYMNLLVWLVPCLLPLLFFTVAAHAEFSDERYWKLEQEDLTAMFWINIPLVIIGMYFISRLVRRWKSIADE